MEPRAIAARGFPAAGGRKPRCSPARAKQFPPRSCSHRSVRHALIRQPRNRAAYSARCLAHLEVGSPPLRGNGCPYASLDPSANAPAVSITVTPAVRPPDWAALFPTASKALQRAMSREPNQIYAGNVGSHIAQALAPNGQSYSALRIAFAYRDRRVPDCKCNGKDIFGMAAIAIETDLTLRPGDIVATYKDLKVFIRSKRGRRNARDFSPSKTAWDVPRILKRGIDRLEVVLRFLEACFSSPFSPGSRFTDHLVGPTGRSCSA